MILHAMFGLAARLTHFGHHGPAIGDDDGACSVCDHPFGDLSHMCIGAAPRMAA